MGRADFQAGVRHAAQFLRTMAAEAVRDETASKMRPLCLTDAAEKLEVEASRFPDLN